MHRITLDYGADDPLILEMAEDALRADCRGPRGERGAAAGRIVTAALDAPAAGPPLASHVVPGDRVVLAVAGPPPQSEAVIAAVRARLAAAGIEAADLVTLVAPPLDTAAAPPVAAAAVDKVSGGGGAAAFDPASDGQTSYVAADAAGRPIHLARQLVDADVVVAIGPWAWNAAFGGRGLDGEPWPAFSRRQCRHDLTRSLALRGRKALHPWKAANREAAWHLGCGASLRLVAGRGDTLAAAVFGPPDEAARAARRVAVAWSPVVPAAAAVSIASLSDPQGGPDLLLRAVAAAARVTLPGGTICVASRMTAGFGAVFTRWREGVALEPLVREAVGVGDPALLADALHTRLFARALGDRRLVLLSDLGAEAVEELGIGHAATPEVVERLAHRAESVAILHEADRLLPRLGSTGRRGDRGRGSRKR